jgi:hypothetical protein
LCLSLSKDAFLTGRSEVRGEEITKRKANGSKEIKLKLTGDRTKINRGTEKE